MALPDTARNVFGPTFFGDISFVFITIGASGRVADLSSPETDVEDNEDGTYDLTFPPATLGFVVGAPAVIGQAGTAAAEVTAFDADAGTMAIDLGAASLSGVDLCHVVLALAAP